jgi:anti-sigma factor RsiW
VEQSFAGDDADERAVAAVPALVRKLFGVPEPVVAASAAPVVAPPVQRAAPLATSSQQQSSSARVGALTWITLAGGAAVLAGGVVLGASAQSSFDSYKGFEL